MPLSMAMVIDFDFGFALAEMFELTRLGKCFAELAGSWRLQGSELSNAAIINLKHTKELLH